MLSFDYAIRAGDDDPVVRSGGLAPWQLDSPFFSERDTFRVKNAIWMRDPDEQYFLVKWFFFRAGPVGLAITGATRQFFSDGVLRLSPFLCLFEISGVLLPEHPEIDVVEGEALSLAEPKVEFQAPYGLYNARLVAGPRVVSPPWINVDAVDGLPHKTFFYTPYRNAFIQSPGIHDTYTAAAVIIDWDPHWPRERPVLTLRVSVPYLGSA